MKTWDCEESAPGSGEIKVADGAWRTLIGPFVFVRWSYDLHITLILLSLLAGYFLVESTSNSFKLKTVLLCLYQIL